jgi:hypothetical protein
MSSVILPQLEDKRVAYLRKQDRDTSGLSLVEKASKDILADSRLLANSRFRDVSSTKAAVNFLKRIPDALPNLLMSSMLAMFKAALSSPLLQDIAAASAQGGNGIMRELGGLRLESMSMKDRNPLLKSVKSMVDKVKNASLKTLKTLDTLLEQVVDTADGRCFHLLIQEAADMAMEILGMALDFRCRCNNQ